MKNKFIAFRSPETLASRLSRVAQCEHLSVSDIVRRATIHSLKELEEKHQIQQTQTSQSLFDNKSVWQISSR